MDDRPTAPLPGATLDEQSVTSDWAIIQDLIDGVRLHDVRNVIGESGHVTEIFRTDWFTHEVDVEQVFQVTLEGGRRSGWHMHESTTDRLFVNLGQIRVVLYDARPASLTQGRVNVFHLGDRRPALVVVPPGVWHGLRNLSADRGAVLNVVDHAYAYEHPDHWRLPVDTPEIPVTL